jgi:hypothetical protein
VIGQKPEKWSKGHRKAWKMEYKLTPSSSLKGKNRSLVKMPLDDMSGFFKKGGRNVLTIGK